MQLLFWIKEDFIFFLSNSDKKELKFVKGKKKNKVADYVGEINQEQVDHLKRDIADGYNRGLM